MSIEQRQQVSTCSGTSTKGVSQERYILGAGTFSVLVSLEHFLSSIIPVFCVICISLPIPLMFQTLQSTENKHHASDTRYPCTEECSITHAVRFSFSLCLLFCIIARTLIGFVSWNLLRTIPNSKKSAKKALTHAEPLPVFQHWDTRVQMTYTVEYGDWFPFHLHQVLLVQVLLSEPPPTLTVSCDPPLT